MGFFDLEFTYIVTSLGYELCNLMKFGFINYCGLALVTLTASVLRISEAWIQDILICVVIAIVLLLSLLEDWTLLGKDGNMTPEEAKKGRIARIVIDWIFSLGVRREDFNPRNDAFVSGLLWVLPAYVNCMTGLGCLRFWVNVVFIMVGK